MSSYFDKLARVESSNNPNAKAKTSSATGLYQMTRPTFEGLRLSDPKLAKITWEQHNADPNIQRVFAQALTNQNVSSLTKKGFAANDLNKYLAHFAGAGGASKLLSAPPDAKVADILGKQAAAANPSLINAKTTVADLIGTFAKKLGVPPSLAQAKQNAMPAGVPNPMQQAMTPSAPAMATMPPAMSPTMTSAQIAQAAKLAQLNQGQQAPQAPQGLGSLSNLDLIRLLNQRQGQAQAAPMPQQAQQQAAMPAVAMQQSPGIVTLASGGEIAKDDDPDAPWNRNKKAAASSANSVVGQAPSSVPSSTSNSDADEAIASDDDPNAPWNKKKSFGQKAKRFLGDAFSGAAKALNTRPEQLSGSLLSGGFKVREKTAEEEKLGPTMAADRARRWAGIGQGAILDPLMAGAQLLPGQKGEEIARDQMQGYESFRNQLGDKGFDTSRLAGNIMSPVAVKGAGWIDKGLNKTGAGLFKRGAIQGSAAAAIQPIVPSGEEANAENPEYGSGILGEKAMQIGGGALLGGSFNKLLGKYLPSASGGGGGQAGSPVERYRQAFPDADLTWGQLAGARANRLEQRATSIPFLGDIINEARTKALHSQNVGMMNRALKDAGLKLDKGTKPGRDMFDEASNKLSAAYNKVLDDIELTDPQALRGKIYGKMDTGTGKSLATQGQLDNSYTPGAISQKYNQLSEAGQKRFDKIMEEGLFSKFGKDPSGNHSVRMTGRQFKTHEEDLKDTIDSLMHGGGEEREIGKMVKTALKEAYDSLKSNDPKVTDQFKKLNKSYAQYKTLEKASTASSTAGGIFTPAQTIRAATRGNQTNVAKGKGLLQDEAELSQQVLGQAYPDSGTAGRLQSSKFGQNIIGGILSLPAEVLYSPQFASLVTQGGTRAKNAFQRTKAGAGLAKPDVSPGIVRGIMGPESPQEEVPMASGGLVTERINQYLGQRFASGGPITSGGLGIANEFLQNKILLDQAQKAGIQLNPIPMPPQAPPQAPPGQEPPPGMGGMGMPNALGQRFADGGVIPRRFHFNDGNLVDMGLVDTADTQTMIDRILGKKSKPTSPWDSTIEGLTEAKDAFDLANYQDYGGAPPPAAKMPAGRIASTGAAQEGMELPYGLTPDSLPYGNSVGALPYKTDPKETPYTRGSRADRKKKKSKKKSSSQAFVSSPLESLIA